MKWLWQADLASLETGRLARSAHTYQGILHPAAPALVVYVDIVEDMLGLNKKPSSNVICNLFTSNASYFHTILISLLHTI